MKIVEKGHIYNLDSKESTIKQKLMFFKDEKIHGEGHNGALNQEVLRVLIDRVKYLEQELPSPENETILYHLRSALIEHEVRALRRKCEKGKLKPENVQIGSDGHFRIG